MSGDERRRFYTHRDLTSDYYQTLIAHGRPSWCKVVWLLVTLAFLGTTIYLVYTLVKSYLEFSSFNKVSVRWQSSLALPAITICNINSINFAELETDIEPETLDDFGKFMVRLAAHDGSVKISDEMEADTTRLLDAKIKNLMGEEVSIFDDFQFDPAAFILGDGKDHYQAKFAGKWIRLDFGEENGTRSQRRKATNIGFHKYGSCIILNDDLALVQQLGGPRGGLTIDLDAKVTDYLPTTATKGFIVYLRSPNETVIMNLGGILVSPGTETFIGVSKSEVTRLKPRFGNCHNFSSPFVPTVSMSVRECVQELQLKTAVEECGCVPWYLSRTLQHLNLTQYEEMFEDMLREEGHDEDQEYECGFATQAMCDTMVLEDILSRNETDCPEPCYFEEYSWRVNVGDFPATETYWDVMLKERIKTEHRNESFEYAKGNFVRIHIYYEDIKVTQKMQEKAYQVFNFIAELGGTVDMMIGFSFFTLFQLFEILIVCSIVRCCVKQHNSHSDCVVENHAM